MSKADLVLDRRSDVPFHRQIYERVRDAIARGTLNPGDRLPSARSLANQLGTARGTVDTAYAVLAGEGYIVARGAAGTIVAPALKSPAIAALQAKPTAVPRLLDSPVDIAPGTVMPFQMGLPALDAFPRKLWTRLAARHARHLSPATMAYTDGAGHAPLRAAVMRYLAVARGIVCTPNQVLLTAGYHGAVGLISRSLLDPGDRVWFEDPGFHLARRSLEMAGARIVPVPVDGDGIDVGAGIERARRARFAVVTPSHQMPLGVALSLSRRLALLAWARDAGAWIIEDDYDSEYRYTGRPLPALKSLDRDGRVLYVGTFSKVLFPGLRLGYLVVPEDQARRFAAVAGALQPDRAALVEATVADFMREGHFARHIRRMRALYAERRLALARALDAVFAGRLKIGLGAGGMHLMARLDGDDDVTAVGKALSYVLAPEALSRMAIEADCGRALLLSFTNIPAQQAQAQARRLKEAIG
ncbi:MAG: PLP-dependent aminotransferase family protein [Alphaproteobacteria bacterium]|nr:PLP-dependent aminotransferase family protein [Alphaproteobacteria bacterium]